MKNMKTLKLCITIIVIWMFFMAIVMLALEIKNNKYKKYKYSYWNINKLDSTLEIVQTPIPSGFLILKVPTNNEKQYYHFTGHGFSNYADSALIIPISDSAEFILKEAYFNWYYRKKETIIHDTIYIYSNSSITIDAHNYVVARLKNIECSLAYDSFYFDNKGRAVIVGFKYSKRFFKPSKSLNEYQLIKPEDSINTHDCNKLINIKDCNAIFNKEFI